MSVERGINLGGWLVIERWMTPSLFEGTDARNEFELARTEEGRRRIQRHHDTFITKRDLTWLKKKGVTLLRVPVGYWVFGADDRYVEAAGRLDWLMRTSLSLGLNVLLDLHAAPEAQNRAAHSGSGNTMSNKHSTKWLNNISAQDSTIKLLQEIAARYSDFPNVWGIQLLNEPSVDRFGLKLARFYRRAYRAVADVARPGTRIVFSDAYAPFRMTNCLWLVKKPDYPVVMDTHIYQIFGSRDQRRSYGGATKRLKWVRGVLRLLSWQQPIIVGEWSAMLPGAKSSDETSRYASLQRSAFAPAIAEMYWSYKTEDPGRWNYRDMSERGLIQ